MLRKEPRVLFFTQSSNPTDEEVAQSRLIGYNVGFRVASLDNTKESIEETDAVAGAAPNRYRALFPHVSSANELTEVMRKKARGLDLNLPRYGANEPPEPVVTEAMVAELAGETHNDGDDDGFDEDAFLADKSADYKMGYFNAQDPKIDPSMFPADTSDDFKAGFAFHRETFETDVTGEPGDGQQPAADDQPKKPRARRKAAAPATTTPPAGGGGWGQPQ